MLRTALKKYPIITNSICYGTLYFGAEFCQQTLTRKLLIKENKPRLDYDWKALGRIYFIGSVVLGPTAALWYKWLDKKYVGTSIDIITKKLILDQVVITPPLLSTFFVGISVLEGQEDIFEDWRKKFLPTYQKCLMFWIPIQIINFLFISNTYRVIYISTCAFLWVNILCVIKRNN